MEQTLGTFPLRRVLSVAPRDIEAVDPHKPAH
jgi:hypothetical protein